MADFSDKQKEILAHSTCRAIYEFLQGDDKPAALGEIGEAIELPDLAVVFFHLNRLVKVEMVEKVWGIERYRVVGE